MAREVAAEELAGEDGAVEAEPRDLGGDSTEGTKLMHSLSLCQRAATERQRRLYSKIDDSCSRPPSLIKDRNISFRYLISVFINIKY